MMRTTLLIVASFLALSVLGAVSASADGVSIGTESCPPFGVEL